MNRELAGIMGDSSKNLDIILATANSSGVDADRDRIGVTILADVAIGDVRQSRNFIDV